MRLKKEQKELLVQISQPVYVFGIGLPFMYFFAYRVGAWLLGPLSGNASFGQKLALLVIWEAGLVAGCIYATLCWILTMKFFLAPQEIRAQLSEPQVPVVSAAVLKVFSLVFE